MDQQATQDRSVAELARQLSLQTTELARHEVELAKAEMRVKGKRAGIGAGMFGGAGALGLYALGALTAAIIAGIAEALPVWAAALIVAALYGAVAGILALRGKSKVQQATPPRARGDRAERQGGRPLHQAARPGGQAMSTPSNQQTDPEQLRREIEAIRRELGETVAQLAHKADVKAQAREKVAGGQGAAPCAARPTRRAAARSRWPPARAGTRFRWPPSARWLVGLPARPARRAPARLALAASVPSTT